MDRQRKSEGWIEVWLALFALGLLGGTSFHIINKHKDSERGPSIKIDQLETKDADK